ncbi:hypothetical protein [Halomonas sp. hl-4]|uniref:hypothetical protein n=1 Tax=Halomonas sp. hl-4 TaxID=1761789 RepID=UPI0012FDD938|nr:hypothetical protein [Halomonas sp. hl-4]
MAVIKEENELLFTQLKIAQEALEEAFFLSKLNNNREAAEFNNPTPKTTPKTKKQKIPIWRFKRGRSHTVVAIAKKLAKEIYHRAKQLI